MPSSRFDPATIESLLLNGAARILRNALATPLSVQLEDFFINDLSEEIQRSSLLLSMAEKGKDDASQTTKVAFQTLLDWKFAVDTVRQVEKKLKDSLPTLSASNDELFEKITSREEWYLRCSIDSFDGSELESALRRTPITDSAALGAHLCKQLTDTMLGMKYDFNDTAACDIYKNLTTLILSIGETHRRREVDIFHSLVLMIGMFQPFNLCTIRQNIHCRTGTPDQRTLDRCPAHTLSDEILKTMADTFKNRQGLIQPGQHQAPSWNFVYAWRSLMGSSERRPSMLVRGLGYPPNKTIGSFPCGHAKCRSKQHCSGKFVYSVIRALREAAVDEVTEKARILCAGRLPVELSDVVAEAALIAEELPLESVVQESEACATPSTMQE